MDRFLVQFERCFVMEAIDFMYRVEAFFPNRVGQIPRDAKVKIVVFLMFVVVFSIFGFAAYFLVSFVRLLWLSFGPGGLQ